MSTEDHPSPDVLGLGEVWAATSGAEFARAFGADGSAPQVELLGYHVVDATSGSITLDWDVPTRLLNLAGIAHGGFVSAVLDDASGLSVGSTYDRFVPQLTVRLQVDFLRPVLAGETHRVTGEVVRRGRTTSVADARVESADGRLCARASGVFQPNRRVIPRDQWEAAGLR